MTERDREQVAEVLSKWIAEHGAMPLRVMRSTLKSAGIAPSIYEEMTPKQWITMKFPEFGIIGTNGREQIVVVDKIQRLVKEAIITADGSFLLSSVAPLLSLNGINWREHANGKKLHEWLSDAYPAFSITDDKLRVYLKNGPPPSPSPSPSSQEQPTRNYVYQFCYFPANPSSLPQIRELIGDSTLTPMAWAAMRTRIFAERLLGLNGGLLDDSRSDPPRMAFTTGLKTALNQDIYGILTHNDNKGATQPWICNSFCFPGQKDPNGNGLWLCRAFALSSQLSYGQDNTQLLSTLEDTLNTLKQTRIELISCMDSVRELLAGGSPLPEAFSASVVQYADTWNVLRKTLDSLEVDLPPEGCSIEFAERILSQWNDSARVIEEAVSRFNALSSAAWKYMTDNLLCPENRVDADIARWSDLLKRISNEPTSETAEQLRAQLEPFHALRELHSFDLETRKVFDDREYLALEQINAHFGSKLNPSRLRLTILSEDADLSFLEKLPEIEALLTSLEYSGKSREMAAAPSDGNLDDMALLGLALDGGLWASLPGAFPAPNPLETAAMLGELETIHKIIGDPTALDGMGYSRDYQTVLQENAQVLQSSDAITPVSAAERLKSLLGQDCRQIDRCLLLGLTQGEKSAAEHLLTHYLDQERYPLVKVLYTRCKDQFDVELRRRSLLALVASGNCPLDEAVQDNVLALLTEDGIAAVSSMAVPESAELKKKLLTLYRRIQPTLLHHVVFLSRELQSYILRPENQTELNDYHLDLSESGIPSLLKRESYARGSTPLQVAMRIDAFLGDWGGLAEQFALLTPNTTERQSFLLKMAMARDDEERVFAVLAENQELQRQNIELYRRLLFRAENYDAFCDTVEEDALSDLPTQTLMQLAIAQMRAGKWTGMLPERAPEEIVEQTELLLPLGQELAARDSGRYAAYLTALFPAALTAMPEEQLQQLVTANGTLEWEAVWEIAAYARENCPALTAYCCNIIQSDEFRGERDAYLNCLYDRLNNRTGPEQYNIIRELRVLYPEQYAVVGEKLMDAQMTSILQEDQSDAVKAEKISDLLNTNPITDSVYARLLTQLDGLALTAYAPLYRDLISLAPSQDAHIACVRLLHRCRDRDDAEFRRFLCEQYAELVLDGKMPSDLLTESESVILAQLRRHGIDLLLCRCVYRMERLRERTPYAAFVLFTLAAQPEDALTPDMQQELGGDMQRLFENPVSELSLFCGALEDSEVDIREYLTFCSAFVPEETPDEAPSPELADSAETDAIAVLHALYSHPASGTYWSACVKLPFRDRPAAYANALYHCACCLGGARETGSDTGVNQVQAVDSANSAWENCVIFALSEGQNEAFFRAVYMWIHTIDVQYSERIPWYAAKHFVQTIQGLLDADDALRQSEIHVSISGTYAFPIGERAAAADMLREVIRVFKRIDLSRTDIVNQDDNHNTLRMIIELGVKLDCEMLLIEQLFDELTGPYVNLGLAMICRLLLVGKQAEAREFLPKFAAQAKREYNYHNLVNKLAKMREAELLEWTGDEGNRATLRFILPNGNVPDILRLQTLVMTGIAEGSTDVSIAVIENLLDCYSKDVMCYTSLFILCKEDYSRHLPRILRSLNGVYKYYPVKGRLQFTRSQLDLIKLISILRYAMEMMGYPAPDTDSVTELIRSYSLNPDKVDQTVIQQNNLAEEIRSLFVGVANGTLAYDLRIKSLLGAVTGNWKPFIETAFENRITNWVPSYNIMKYSFWGLLRGVLRVWRQQPSGEAREVFADWLQEEAAREGPSSPFQRHVGVSARVIMSQLISDNINWDMLALPWEEHFVCLGNLKDTKRPEKNSCYKWMMLMRPKDRSAKDSFTVAIRLAQDGLKAQLLSGNAQEWFKAGDYALAGASYEALFRNGLVPVKVTTPEQRDFYKVYYAEFHQTWARIAYALAGTPQLFSQGRELSVHSCSNMIIALLNGGYAKYYDRLRICFTGINRSLFYTIRQVLSSSAMSGDEMIKMADKFRNRAALIAYLRFLLGKDRTGKYLFLSNQNQIDDVRVRLKRQESSQSAREQSKHWFELQVHPMTSLFPPLADMDEEADALSATAGELDLDSNDEGFEPAFLMDADGLCRDGEPFEDADSLVGAYGNLTPYTDSDYSKRMAISAQIYLLTRRNDSDPAKLRRAIVQFGVDYYRYHRYRVTVSGPSDREWSYAHRAMFDLARYGLNAPAVNAIVSQQLPDWYQYSVRGFSSIDKLMEDFSDNKKGYIAVAKLLSDTEHANAANGILEMLNDLLTASNRLGSRTLDTAGYQAAQSRLNDIDVTRDWNEMAAHLSELLRHALNKLDQRPSLQITLFNKEYGLQNDSLYGQIMNTGRASATELLLQATFPNNQRQSISALYRFSELRPNETATFAIRYAADDDILELEYTLNLNYSDHQTKRTVEPVSGVLAISPNVKAPAQIPQFDTQRASAFTVDGTGKIVSPYFTGRKSEIRKLTGLLKGPEFSRYGSAIVQGIKRSGKTSLLNYLRAYIRQNKSDNTIHLFSDCQNAASQFNEESRQYIYRAFFYPVLFDLPLEYPAVRSHHDWDRFVATWQRGASDPDSEPGDLSVFYRQLHTMLDGHGIFLIVDEFDWLLEDLQATSGYEGLLKALRGLQMNPDCFEAVHIVLCGSNHLLAYNRDGSYLNQMFQSYESIQVGQMLTTDIRDMIYSLLDTESVIRFDNMNASIQWIERYTGGLVWYTRLLVNEVIQNVLKDGRNCVYPSDVCDAFDSICCYQNCRQFIEGCTDQSLLVLDAVQGLADRFGNYVSVDQIAQQLKSRLTMEQLVQSLSLLTDTLELLERQSPSSKLYRFRVEIYRRYFRQQAGTETLDDCFRPTVLSVETDDADSEFD